MRLPDGSGIDLLRWLKSNDNDAPVIMISGHGTIADAVEATRAGAFDFLEKPLGREHVLLVAAGMRWTRSKLREENRHLRELVGGARMIGVESRFRARGGAGDHGRAQRCARVAGRRIRHRQGTAGRAHPRRKPVFRGSIRQSELRGDPTELIESELFGHEKGAFTGATSARRGKFELADRGTLFLDEVGDLHAASQAKLLRVLQEGEFHRVGGEQAIRVSVRVIAATNRDLSEMVAQQKFREDLYYRLCVVPVRVPQSPRAARRYRRTGRIFSGRVLRAQQLQSPSDCPDARSKRSKTMVAGQHSRAAQYCRAHGDSDARR